MAVLVVMPKGRPSFTYVNILHTPCEDTLQMKILEMLRGLFYNKYKSSLYSNRFWIKWK